MQVLSTVLVSRHLITDMISCAQCDLLLGRFFVISVAFRMSEDYMCLCVIMPIMNLVSILCYNLL